MLSHVTTGPRRSSTGFLTPTATAAGYSSTDEGS